MHSLRLSVAFATAAATLGLAFGAAAQTQPATPANSSVQGLPKVVGAARHPRIEAIKDCGGNTAKTQALIADGRLQVLTGEDAQIFHALALGGAGAISACAHWQTPRFVEFMALLRLGDLPAARHLWQSLQPWVAACFAEPNPAPLKAMLAHAGWMRSELRAPMMPASKALQDRLKAL